MASPAPARGIMLPPTPCTIYLCTPPSHPFHCTFYALTRAETTTHLLSTHPETANYRAAYGDLGLRALPIQAVLHAPTEATAAAEHVFVCFCCRLYFPLESTLLRHLADKGLSQTITAQIGEEGLRAWVRTNCRRRLVATEAPRVDHAMDVMQRYLLPPVIPPVQITVRNTYRAVNFHGSCNVTAPPAPAGVPMRLSFTWPLTRANPLVTLTTPSLDALRALVVREYEGVVGRVAAAEVDWDARIAKGVVVRYDKRGGGGGACVLRTDEDLCACWGEMEFAEVFVGDGRDAPV